MLPSDITEIESDIQSIKGNATLFEERNFFSRADAIDFIGFHIIDRIDGLLQGTTAQDELNVLKQRAEIAKSELEEIDNNLFELLRRKIKDGLYPPSRFKNMVCEYVGDYNHGTGELHDIGYDNLDIFINGLLSGQGAPEPTIEREPDMVFYQKTPARIVFEMAEMAGIKAGDIFFDLGSGLGQVALLVNLISGAKTIGIEYEPAYCSYANKCASQLNLQDVAFINADARAADYSEGNIFFMYTPFGGSILQEVLEILKVASQKRAIKIFTYGPCSSHIAQQQWLDCINGDPDDLYTLCEFKSKAHLPNL